jgi:hypothetical protein
MIGFLVHRRLRLAALWSAQVTFRKENMTTRKGNVFRGARKTIAEMFYVAGRGTISTQK